jgi:hypothetical protein
MAGFEVITYGRFWVTAEACFFCGAKKSGHFQRVQCTYGKEGKPLE